MSLRKILIAFGLLIVLGGLTVAGVLAKFSADLPKMITVQDYNPLLVSEVYDRNGKTIGEFFREKRILVPYDKIPKDLVHAFVAAEDATFFQHGGVNYVAILRAILADLRTGRKSQGASTITQQVARSLLLTSAKTYSRKIKEILLARRMEHVLTKEQILYLYLNQIYLGEGAYGVGAAAQIYFHKNVSDLTVPEAAILAGLPQAPSRYSPVDHPHAAKDRQRYVLNRMADVGFLTQDQAKQYAETPVVLYVPKNYDDVAPFYLETVRQMLVADLGEETVLDKGLKIYTGLDLDRQTKAQEEVRQGLRALDKRQGYRGALKNITDPKEVAAFLLKTRNDLMDASTDERILQPDGHFPPRGPLNLAPLDAEGQSRPNVPSYIPLGKIIHGVVTKVDDQTGLTYVRFAESKGLIDIGTMDWARKPDPNVKFGLVKVKNPSEVLKTGDVILIKVVGNIFKSDRLNKMKPVERKKLKGLLPEFKQYADLELEQEPITEGALLAIDQKTSDIISMVGGYDYSHSKFNRALQAARQTGSAFKPFVYLSALDKGFTPATPIIDSPVVFDQPQTQGDQPQLDKDGKPIMKIWRPRNDTNRFGGDVLFRNALIRSLNVPSVKIIEKVGVDWVATYARRLGIFSPLNMDFTLALGSSGITLYEMTKAFGVIGRLGRSLSPILIHKVVDPSGKVLLQDVSLDDRLKTELSPFQDDFEKRREAYLKDPNSPASKKEPPIFFADKDQLIKPQTAYVLTTILQGVIDDAHGTGGAARVLGRPLAGKTGTSSGYYDAWFLGFSADIVAGVWVGFDQEKTLGRGEFGATAALPIWMEYMKSAHEGIPPHDFQVPDGIVFANIDNKTGNLVSSDTTAVVRQAFVDGTQPNTTNDPSNQDKDSEFYKEDLSE